MCIFQQVYTNVQLHAYISTCTVKPCTLRFQKVKTVGTLVHLLRLDDSWQWPIPRYIDFHAYNYCMRVSYIHALICIESKTKNATPWHPLVILVATSKLWESEMWALKVTLVGGGLVLGNHVVPPATTTGYNHRQQQPGTRNKLGISQHTRLVPMNQGAKPICAKPRTTTKFTTVPTRRSDHQTCLNSWL